MVGGGRGFVSQELGVALSPAQPQPVRTEWGTAQEMQLLSRLAALLFTCAVLLLGVSGSTTASTNNWAVLVCSVSSPLQLSLTPAKAS